MKVVEQIKAPIYAEMELFEEKFTASMSSKVALLNRITHFIVNRKGNKCDQCLFSCGKNAQQRQNK